MLNAELKIAYDKFMEHKDYEKGYQCVRNDVGLVGDYRQKISEIVKKDPSRELLDLLKESYFLTARDNFDDFMIAMEWDRPSQSKFWLPRRKVLEGNLKICTTIQDFIDDPMAKLLALSLPPATGKTTLIKFLLAYIIGKDPLSANMYCTYSDAMSKIMYDSLVAMTDPDGEYNFNRIFGLGKPTVSADYRTISYRKQGDFPTVGLVALGGSVTGRTRANHFFVTDDLVKNKEEARSPERLEKLYDDYNSTLKTRRIGKCKEIMLGTIWSLYDPISRRKTRDEGKDGYYFIAYPVCDEQGHSNFLYDHEDRYSDELIAELKEDLDPADFSCLYLQKGIQKEGLAFASDRLKYYNGVLPDGEPDNIILYGDIAWGGGDSFSVPICYQYGKDGYIHDVMFDRSDKTITKPRLVAKILVNNVRMGCMESNNGGAELCDDVNKMLKQEGYSMNLVSKRAKGEMNKLTRIEQHQQAIRNLYFRGENYRDNEYKQFMNELTIFSFTSKNLHDDAPDSLAGLIEFMTNRNAVATVGKRLW